MRDWLFAVLALLALVALVLTASTYAVRADLLRRGGPWPPPEPIGLFGALAGLAKEWFSLALTIVCSCVPWIVPNSADGGSRSDVVLLHEWGVTRGSLLWLTLRLRRDGWNAFAFARQPAGSFDLEATADDLRRFIDDGSDRPLTLIGHGAGGVVVRHACRSATSRRVVRIVTIGSPYRGSELSAYGYCPLLRPGSDYLRQLYPDGLPQQLDAIALHSAFDAFVLPPVNALYPNAFNIQLNDLGHFTLLLSPKVYRLIAENLAAPLPDASTPRFRA